MKNLKVWQKLLVVGVILMLPFGAVTWRMVSSINALGTEFARQESRGLEYYAPLLGLLNDLQEQRGLSSIWLSGDASFKSRVDAKREDVEKDVRSVDEVDQRLDGALHTRARWTELSDDIRNLASRSSNATPSESFERKSKTVEKTIALLTRVGDVSNLTLDPDLDSYYVMNILIFQGPELSEVVAQARGLGSRIAANKGSDPDELDQLNRLAILMGFLEKKVDDSLGKISQANPTLKTQMDAESRSAVGAVHAATDRATKLVRSRGRDVNAAEYFDALNGSVKSLFEMQQRGTDSLNVLLQNRIAKFSWEGAATLEWAGLGLLTVSGVGLFMARDMTASLRRVVDAAIRSPSVTLPFRPSRRRATTKSASWHRPSTGTSRRSRKWPMSPSGLQPAIWSWPSTRGPSATCSVTPSPTWSSDCRRSSARSNAPVTRSIPR